MSNQKPSIEYKSKNPTLLFDLKNTPLRSGHTLFIFCIILMITGCCGYHFKSRLIKLEGVKSFSKIIVNNDTFEPGLANIFKNDLTTVFKTNSWMKSSPETKDETIFLLKITSFSNKASSHSSGGTITQYEVKLLMDVTIYNDNDPDTIFFSLKDRTYAENYVVNNDIRVTSQNKKVALERISEKFSVDIEDSISQGF